MADSVAGFMLNRLSEWGVRRVYGYRGGGINGISARWSRRNGWSRRRAADRFGSNRPAQAGAGILGTLT